MFGCYQVSNKLPSLILTRKSQASGPHYNLFYSFITHTTAVFDFYIEKSQSDYRSVVSVIFLKFYNWVLHSLSLTVPSVQKAQNMYACMNSVHSVVLAYTQHDVSDWEQWLAKDVKMLQEWHWDRNRMWKIIFPCFFIPPLCCRSGLWCSVTAQILLLPSLHTSLLLP